MEDPIKILAIINPISGTGKQKNIELLLKKHLISSRFALQVKYTQYPNHASELTQESIKDNFQAVMAVGGDGTINEIARSLTGSNVALGIIPCGSGNGLARHLGIPMNPRKAIEWINQAQIKSMDTISANDQLFVNVGGIGFDAHISHQFANMTSRGLTSYIKATVSSFFSFTNQTFKITSTQGNEQIEGFMLSFANSCQFGNNAYIAPKASIMDGKLDLVVMRKPHLYQIPYLLFRTFTKTIHNSSLVKNIQGTQFQIEQSGNIAHLDGEPVELGNKIILRVNPSSLKIFADPQKNI